MIRRLRTLLLILLFIPVSKSFAQTDSSVKRFQVAVFTPLYLDSVFDVNNGYKPDKYFPKYVSSGLEFYEGIQLALDSLQKEKAPLDIFVYDLKSVTQPLSTVLSDQKFSDIDLIIGNVNNTEMILLANLASQRKIPFINVNFPNDGGITNNPYFVILNSTLKTHCEGIYRFMQRQFPLDDIVVFRKKGAQEDRLQSYFTDFTKTTASVPLRIKYVNLEDAFDSTLLTLYLNKSRQTVCVAGSLDLNFANSLVQKLSSISGEYNVKLIGMPNWDGLPGLNKPGLKTLEVIYSTPFNSATTSNTAMWIQDYFKNRFYSRPSDMVYRGYETMYRFAKLLIQYGQNLNTALADKKFNVFTEFDIQPVYTNRQNMTLDYFENKKLYFIRKLNGAIAGIN
jgi:hypothetical protein